MQTGPRFLTNFDINKSYEITSLQPGEAFGQTGGGNGYSINDLGQVGQTADGRQFRLASVDVSAAVNPGVVLTSTYGNSAFYGLAIGAASVQTQNTAFGNPDSVGVSALNNGSTSFVIVNGADAVTADQFKGGFAEVNQVSTGPTSYLIAGNSAAAADGNITLLLAEPLANETALIPGTDTVNLYPPSFTNLGAPSTTGRVVGLLPLVANATSNNTSGNPYGVWLLTKGHGVAHVSGAVTEGDSLTLSSTVDGNLEVAAAGDPIYAVALQTTTAAGPCSVHVSVD
jgi:hypothetical protein